MPLIALVSQGYAAHLPHWAGTLLAAGAPLLSPLTRVGQAGRKPAMPVRPAADRERLDAERLCRLLEETTRLSPHRKPGKTLASLLRGVFQLEAVAILDNDLDEVYLAGEWNADPREALKNICIFGRVSDDAETGLSQRVLRIGNLPIGALLLRGETRGQNATAIASLVAITFDRYHTFANERRTESARQAEQMRTTVLDGLAHAYKTPLTVIGAASEGLLAMGQLTPAQAGMAALIVEQTAQLARLTTQLLTTARLQTSEMAPRPERVEVAGLIEDVVASLRDALGSVAVKIALSADDLSLCCDRSLLVALLTQYVDNAAKYGAAGSTVTIEAAARANEMVFSVHNDGPVIPAADFEKIFDRYYRSSRASNRAPGTGIGLSVAKRSAQAQGGYVWVTSDAAQGTTFYAALPKAPRGDATS